MLSLISRFFRLNATVVVGTLLVLVAIMIAYRDGYKQGKREGDLKIATLQQQQETDRRVQAERQLAIQHQLQARYQQQLTEISELDAAYQQKLQQLETDNEKLQRQIASVTRRYIDASGKSHPVNCVFTHGFVQQYNRAFGHGHNASAAATASGTGAASGTLSAADSLLRDSGVSQRDVLAAASDAGHQCQQLAAQVNGLLDYIDKLKKQEIKP